jgi:hypothetical protein
MVIPNIAIVSDILPWIEYIRCDSILHLRYYPYESGKHIQVRGCPEPGTDNIKPSANIDLTRSRVSSARYLGNTIRCVRLED